jgi:copper chaperone CopZ
MILYILFALNTISFKVDGLTCSMCSFSVKKSIEKVYFVEKAEADVETVSYEVQFKKNHYIDFYAIENAVLDAGFVINKESVIIDAKNTNDFWQNSNYIVWKNE